MQCITVESSSAPAAIAGPAESSPSAAAVADVAIRPVVSSEATEEEVVVNEDGARDANATAVRAEAESGDNTFASASAANAVAVIDDDGGRASGGATVAAPGSTNDNDNDNSANAAEAEEVSVCSFLVTDLQAGSGYARTDYRVELIKSRHGLYDLVSLIFDRMREERLTYDSIHKHLWDLQLAGKKYSNGWRRQNFLTGEFERPPNRTDLDEGERRLLNGLAVPIEAGQSGWCSGRSATFELSVENADLTPDDELASYPRITAVPIRLSGRLEDDWITSDDKTRAVELASAWHSYMNGENEWKRDRYTREYTLCKPNHTRVWGRPEVEIMGLLLNAGMKFKKSWKTIMQYAFVDRAETAASYQWYKQQKDDWRLRYVGEGLDGIESIRLAKRLSKSLLRRHLEKGAPKKQPHPFIRVEAALRKKRKIDDTTSAEEIKWKCAAYIGMVRELEDDGTADSDEYF